MGYVLPADSHVFVCRKWDDLAARLVWARQGGYRTAKARRANKYVDRRCCTPSKRASQRTPPHRRAKCGNGRDGECPRRTPLSLPDLSPVRWREALERLEVAFIVLGPMAFELVAVDAQGDRHGRVTHPARDSHNISSRCLSACSHSRVSGCAA